MSFINMVCLMWVQDCTIYFWNLGQVFNLTLGNVRGMSLPSCKMNTITFLCFCTIDNLPRTVLWFLVGKDYIPMYAGCCFQTYLEISINLNHISDQKFLNRKIIQIEHYFILPPAKWNESIVHKRISSIAYPNSSLFYWMPECLTFKLCINSHYLFDVCEIQHNSGALANQTTHNVKRHLMNIHSRGVQNPINWSGYDMLEYIIFLRDPRFCPSLLYNVIMVSLSTVPLVYNQGEVGNLGTILHCKPG